MSKQVIRKRSIRMSYRAKFDCGTANRIDCWNVDCDFLLSESQSNHLKGWDQIRIATYQDNLFGNVLIGVIQQLYRDIDICTLFFRDFESTVPVKRTRCNATSRHFIFEFAKYDCYQRQCCKGQQIGCLTYTRLPMYGGGEVVDCNDFIVWQKTRKVRFKIQPLVGSSANCTVIKIETVNVDAGSHYLLPGEDIKKGQSYRLAKPANEAGESFWNTTPRTPASQMRTFAACWVEAIHSPVFAISVHFL